MGDSWVIPAVTSLTERSVHTLTFVVASDVAFEQIVDAVEQDVGAVEHIEVVAQSEVIFVRPEKKIRY